jgi:hypothetical protein
VHQKRRSDEISGVFRESEIAIKRPIIDAAARLGNSHVFRISVFADGSPHETSRMMELV